MDKWEKFYIWITEQHYDVIRKQRIALKNGVHIHIKDDDDIINILEKMKEFEKDECEAEYRNKINNIEKRR